MREDIGSAHYFSFEWENYKKFERGVKESIYERMEQPAMNKKGGLRFTLSRTWDRAILSATFNKQSYPSAVNANQHSHTGHSTDDSPMGRTETSWN